jgi:hypothetical protein
MKLRILVFAAVALLAGGATLWYFLGREDGLTIRITQQQIDEALAEKFPKKETYLILLEATFLNPRVTLLPELEKIRLGADVEVTLLGLDEDDALTGSLDVLTDVRYEPNSHSFFLHEPVIEKLVIQDLPEKYLRVLSNQALELSIDSVESTPVYTLDPDETEEVAAGMLIREIDILDDAIHITLGL